MTAIGPQPATLLKAVTTAGTAVPLTATTIINGQDGAFLQAAIGNTNNIYIGESTVDDTYAALSAGQTTPLPQNFDLANLWIDADTNGESVVVYYYK